jgi:hypothetical protein
MSNHEDVLRQQAKTWERYGGFPEGASAADRLRGGRGAVGARRGAERERPSPRRRAVRFPRTSYGSGGR